MAISPYNNKHLLNSTHGPGIVLWTLPASIPFILPPGILVSKPEWYHSGVHSCPVEEGGHRSARSEFEHDTTPTVC